MGGWVGGTDLFIFHHNDVSFFDLPPTLETGGFLLGGVGGWGGGGVGGWVDESIEERGRGCSYMYRLNPPTHPPTWKIGRLACEQSTSLPFIFRTRRNSRIAWR